MDGRLCGVVMTNESQSDEVRSSAKSGMIVRATKRLSAVMLVVGLAACSTAPDWARPGLIYGDDAEAAAADPNTEKDFPELSDVPGQIPARSSEAELRAAAEGLAADRERARYSDEVLRGGTGTPAPAPRSAAPAPAPAALPVASIPARAPTTASVASEAGVIPLPARGGRSSLTPTGSEPAAVSDQATRAAATTEIAVQPSPAPQAVAPAPAPQPVAAATPVAPSPVGPAPAAQSSRQPAVPAVPNSGRIASTSQASTSQPSTSSSSATPNYRERPPAPAVTSEPAARTVVAPTPRVAPSVAAAAPIQRSNTSFEPSSAPALTQDALEAAGPVVSSRYGASGAPTGSADPEDPVEVNLDALRGLGPGASLAPSHAAPNGAAYANQGGPGNIPPYVVSFAHGSTGLNAEDRQKIADAAASAAAYSGIVRVVGHASSRTGDLGVGQHLLANFGVSLDRATTVANELIRAGVDASRVVVEAKGDSVPVYYESMPAGEAGNRRAEIFIE